MRLGKKAVATAVLFMSLLVAMAASFSDNAHFTAVAASAPPPLEWSRTYGGNSSEICTSAQQTSDEGYALAGSRHSMRADLYQQEDIYLVKTDSNGTLEWERTYGGLDDEDALSMQQTSDEGYIIAGSTEPVGVYGPTHALLMKTNSSGHMNWSRTYSVDGEYFWSIRQTSEGGYIAGGTVYGEGGDLSNATLVKIDASGNKVWSRMYGEMGINSVQQTSDGGYIGAGSASSNSGDFGLVKTDSSGNVVWKRAYGGAKSDGANSVQQTRDGGYVLAGHTSSYGAGDADAWLVKTDSSGNMIWSQTYGGSGSETAKSVQQTREGGFIVAGNPGYDFWLIKTNSSGGTSWSQIYGGGSTDVACFAQETVDGGYMVAGHTRSYGAGYEDFWLVKLVGGDADEDGLLDTWEKNGIDYPPEDGIIDLDLPAMGADWQHKDIFVEVDYMQGHYPFERGMEDVASAFANAPVDNPDGTPGIRLHIDVDEPIPHQDLVKRDFSIDFMNLKKSYFGTANQRAGADSQNVLDAKKLVYHYCLFAHKISDWNPTLKQWTATNYAGLGERPGNDFMVAMGGFPAFTGTHEDQASAFMHELGHNLGLNHGGATNDDVNYKPNYLSIMNYAFAFPSWIVPWRPLDYSRSKLPTLFEASLDEPYGVQGYGFWQYTIWNDSKSERAFGLVSGPLDWNGNKNNTEWFVRANINNFPAPGWNYPSAPDEALQGHDDWANLKYYFQNTQGFIDGVYLTVNQDEITSDTVAAMQASRMTMHEVGVYNVSSSSPVWSPGSALSVSFALGNLGGSDENVNVTVYANTTTVASSSLVVKAGNLTTFTFPYTGQALNPGNYTLKAVVSQVANETYTADNTITGSVITVTGTIPEFDSTALLAVFIVAVSALILALRKKKTRTL